MANSNNAGEDFCITNSLLKSMLPIGEQVDVKPLLMATDFFNTSTWRSLVMVGQNQVQRNGLLFQASLCQMSINLNSFCTDLHIDGFSYAFTRLH